MVTISYTIQRDLTSPLVKKGDNFEAVSWEEALGVVADAFKRIKESVRS